MITCKSLIQIAVPCTKRYIIDLRDTFYSACKAILKKELIQTMSCIEIEKIHEAGLPNYLSFIKGENHT